MNGDGTYDIAYDDGDAEQGVVRDMIESPYVSDDGGDDGVSEPAKPSGETLEKPSKPSKSSASKTSAAGLSAGSKIEARHGGKEKWFPGSVDKVNGDGTYVIVYDDGDKEQSVAGYRVRGVGWKRKEVLSKDEVVDVHHGGGP